MYEVTPSNLVWSRAAMEAGGPEAREGDRALAALLTVHNIAMNGGLLHSVELHDREEIRRAIEGFRYFGLVEAAEVVSWVGQQVATTDLDGDPDAAGELEEEADRRYGQAVPSDSTLVACFDEVFAERPEVFAPLSPAP